jgi:hypothetical protein
MNVALAITEAITPEYRILVVLARLWAAYRLVLLGLPSSSNKPIPWAGLIGAYTHPWNTRAGSFKIQAMLDSWDDLTTAGTPEFLNSKAGEILSTSPNTLQAFFYIHRTCGRVSTPYRINLPARDIYAPAQDG